MVSYLKFNAQLSYPGGFKLCADFTAARGITALFGPSGSGKTTVLSLIAGLRRPQRGRIELGGTPLFDSNAGINVPARHRRIGYVFQDHLLFPHLSIRKNLLYGHHRRSVGPATLTLDRVTTVLDLKPLLERYPATLSGGERQRVTLGRALLSAPDLLLMDEPLTSIDEEHAGRVLAYVERVTREWHLPTLYVSHRQTEVRRLADQVIVLAAGRVVDTGPPVETLTRITLSELGGPSEITNLLSATRVHSGPSGHRIGHVGDNTLRLPDTAPTDRDAVLVQFLASDVLLVRHDVTGLSARNHLRGRVAQVATLPSGRVLVAVDVGQVIWAEVTPEAVEELQLTVGAEVVCLIKTTALHVV